MALTCPSCSTGWKSIVNFCPQCGIDLQIQSKQETNLAPIKFDYEEQSWDLFKNPVLWIFIGLLVFGAVFAFSKSNSGDSMQSAPQSAQAESQDPSRSTTENQFDASSSEQEVVQLEGEEQEVQADTQDANSEPSTPEKIFSDPTPKATLSLEAWLRKYSIDEALASIQKWSSTYRSINPTQIDEAQTELGDAVTALEAALRHLNSQGYPRISTYDQQQRALEKEVQNYLDEAGPTWIRINNREFATREEIVDFLEGNSALLGKVNSKVNSLLEWLNSNGSRYEVR